MATDTMLQILYNIATVIFRRILFIHKIERYAIQIRISMIHIHRIAYMYQLENIDAIALRASPIGLSEHGEGVPWPAPLLLCLPLGRHW